MSEAGETRRPSWFASTGQPPAWGLVRYAVGGLVVGGALGAALPQVRGTLLAALAGVVVAAAGSGGPSRISRRLGLIASGAVLVLAVVGFATGTHPVWAGLAMGAVAFLTSLMAASAPLGGILGFLLSLGYMLIAAMARVANLFELVSLRWATAHIAAGCIGGLIVVLVGTSQRRRGEPEEVKAATAPLPIAPMLASLRTFDDHARDGIRRAIPLAILMFLFQRDGGRDAFWTFFAAYLVMLTPGKSPKSLASIRVASAVFGVLLLAAISLIVPDRVLFSLGAVILFAGIGYSPPYPIVGGGLTTIGSILMAGAPTGDIAGWAGRRVVDTLVGCAIALAATYLFWPRDTETKAGAAVPVAGT